MESGPGSGNPIDRLTSWARHQSSRRRFFRTLGLVGISALGFIPGAKQLAAAGKHPLLVAAALAPHFIPCEVDSDCPPPATGVCSCTYSACITGGRGVTCSCQPVPCDCSPIQEQAVCSWHCIQQRCVFVGVCEPC